MGVSHPFVASLCTVLFAGVLSQYSPSQLADSTRIFSVNLYKSFSNQDGNILLSPSSLHTILSLVSIGAGDQTFDELTKTLALPNNKSSIYKAYQATLQNMKNLKHSTLNTANKIYIRNDFDINPNYTWIAARGFEAEIETKDFVANKEAAVKDINDWVEGKTNNKIKNLIKEEHIDPSTVAVLVNALYFNGVWSYPFDPQVTLKRKFFLNSTHWETTEMMVSEQSCKYVEDSNLDAKFLELDYEGREFSMMFVLPNKRDGLAAMEAHIEQILLPKNFEEREIIISVPKFKIEQSSNLNTALGQIGLGRLFTPYANLTLMTTSKRQLFLSRIIQKTYIDVNEKGTEAAAASAGFVVDRIGGYRTSFHADHPFLFVLKQTSTGLIQFIGRFSHPEKKYSY